MITVTKPFFPPIEEFFGYVKQVYDNNWLTNNGPLLVQLETKLKEKLDVPHLLVTSNGTIAIQIAIRALELEGEIITTPFSYVATTSSILWQHCTPVFADIDPFTFNMDPSTIEKLITPETTAILPAHVFGNSCDIDAIQEIADRHSLRVIYDGAHCFGTKYKGESVFKSGDISTASFHATKLFNTAEGGAVITNNPDLNAKMEFHRNFGHNGPGIFEDVGINGKNSELHAAFGLANLPYADEILGRLKALSIYYDVQLSGIPLQTQTINPDCEYNYAYYPVIFPTEEILLKTFNALQVENVFTRRYFAPSLNRLKFVKGNPAPVSEDISRRILCLPLYFSLTEKEIERITSIIRKSWRN
ncbi:DegT/DnrJ/EryC1/StrS family aminotransferase [Pollutibacter soli]|uniref:DegT/DnrJ/EryC1/StrS family aminotransferase n=1 Tax=Pollutibacter soli TaxID=3034157 RepID=UPI0030133E15